MINTIKIMGLTLLTLGNLILFGASVYFWKSSKSTANRTSGAFMTALSALNAIVAVGGMFI